jgi:hypothetical protein
MDFNYFHRTISTIMCRKYFNFTPAIKIQNDLFILCGRSDKLKRRKELCEKSISDKRKDKDGTDISAVCSVQYLSPFIYFVRMSYV